MFTYLHSTPLINIEGTVQHKSALFIGQQPSIPDCSIQTNIGLHRLDSVHFYHGTMKNKQKSQLIKLVQGLELSILTGSLSKAKRQLIRVLLYNFAFLFRVSWFVILILKYFQFAFLIENLKMLLSGNHFYTIQYLIIPICNLAISSAINSTIYTLANIHEAW